MINVKVDQDNTSKRVPIALVLDASISMRHNDNIGILNKHLSILIEQLKNGKDTKDSAEICIIKFGNTVEVISPFCEMSNVQVPNIDADGKSTPLGEATNLAIKMLNNRKEEYKEASTSYFQPMLFLMTDGCENDDDQELEKAQEQVQELTGREKMFFLSIAIGDDADLDTLSKFSKMKPYVVHDDASFEALFKFIRASAADPKIKDNMGKAGKSGLDRFL